MTSPELLSQKKFIFSRVSIIMGVDNIIRFLTVDTLCIIGVLSSRWCLRLLEYLLFLTFNNNYEMH